MNRNEFDELWKKGKPPGQQKEEWFRFLEFVSVYWLTNGILNPVVVEIGIRRGGQKRFWEYYDADHIGIDISCKYGNPEIAGDSHDPIIQRKLQEWLSALSEDGKCDLLFIDGDHSYGGVIRDYEMYHGLCSGIVAFHDVRCIRKDVHVSRFWAELKSTARKDESNKTFIEFFHPEPPDHYGIGVII